MLFLISFHSSLGELIQAHFFHYHTLTLPDRSLLPRCFSRYMSIGFLAHGSSGSRQPVEPADSWTSSRRCFPSKANSLALHLTSSILHAGWWYWQLPSYLAWNLRIILNSFLIRWPSSSVSFMLSNVLKPGYFSPN